MALEILTTANFDKRVTSGGGVVVVDVWATGSALCEQMAPILDALSDEYTKKATWFKLDADENSGIVSKYSVSSIPTLLVFKGGALVHSITDAKPKEILIEELSKFF